jgi:hypothetical protein
VKLTVQIVCDILKTGLGLDDEHIWIYNQRRDIPTGDGIFVTVGVQSIVPYGNNRRSVATSGGMAEEVSQQFQETLSINVFSHDNAAAMRLGEVLGALNSTYSAQRQAAESFQLAAVPTSINDTSFLEGTSILYRFSITVRAIRAYSTQGAIEYFDTFPDLKIFSEKGQA